MNKKITTLLIFFSMLICSQANAQCTFRNTALSGNEKISYNLYFNWKFIWVKAGTANMNTVYSTFNGTPSFKCSLTTTTSKKVDKFFMLRDTLLVHSSRDMAPLYYKKVAHEGKRYYVLNMDKNRFNKKEKLLLEVNLDINVWLEKGVLVRK